VKKRADGEAEPRLTSGGTAVIERSALRLGVPRLTSSGKAVMREARCG